MPLPTFRQIIDNVRLVERRAKGQEPGDDLVSRLKLNDAATDPFAWAGVIVAKFAVIAAIALLLAGLFAGGNALMRAMGVQH